MLPKNWLIIKDKNVFGQFPFPLPLTSTIKRSRNTITEMMKTTAPFQVHESNGSARLAERVERNKTHTHSHINIHIHTVNERKVFACLPQLSFDFFIVALSVEPRLEVDYVLSPLFQLFLESGDLRCRALL